MDFIKSNKLFVASSFLTACFGLKVLKDSFEKIYEFIQNPSELDEAKLTEQVKKIINSPEKSHNFDEDPRFSKNVPLYKICLTGGPCGGKTTALAQLTDRLTERGYKVFVVPETPTMTMEGGGMIIMANLSPEKITKFQTYLMKMQMALEDYFTDLAILSGKPSVILCDRGVMDPYAYMSEESWQIILDEQGWSPVNLRDKRYDAVVHLVTAADGAETFYSKGNNNARYEGIEDARKIDKRIQIAWIGHPHFTIIDNNVKSFEHKLNRLYSTICKFIGIPISSRFFRKFLLKTSYSIPNDIKVEEFIVEEIFLKSAEGIQSKLRKRGQGETFSYMHSLRNTLKDNERNEIRKPITARDFMFLSEQRDENKKILQKKRLCFIWEKQYYIIDIIHLEKELHLLRFDTQTKEEESKIPDFLQIVAEVTDDKDFSSFNIAGNKFQK